VFSADGGMLHAPAVAAAKLPSTSKRRYRGHCRHRWGIWSWAEIIGGGYSRRNGVKTGQAHNQ
jgi:hypothetical protein